MPKPSSRLSSAHTVSRPSQTRTTSRTSPRSSRSASVGSPSRLLRSCICLWRKTSTRDTGSLHSLRSYRTHGERVFSVAQIFISQVTILCTALHRAYARDPKLYPDPEEFKPERYLKDGKPDPSVQDPTTIIFGYGRRCTDFRFRLHAKWRY